MGTSLTTVVCVSVVSQLSAGGSSAALVIRGPAQTAPALSQLLLQREDQRLGGQASHGDNNHPFFAGMSEDQRQ